MMIIWPTKSDEHLSGFFHIADHVAKNPPETWSIYPENITGYKAIVGMEMQELMKELDVGEDKTEKAKECVHLAAACYRLWKELCNE